MQHTHLPQGDHRCFRIFGKNKDTCFFIGTIMMGLLKVGFPDPLLGDPAPANRVRHLVAKEIRISRIASCAPGILTLSKRLTRCVVIRSSLLRMAIPCL
jgi:hypothetical protein